MMSESSCVKDMQLCLQMPLTPIDFLVTFMNTISIKAPSCSCGQFSASCEISTEGSFECTLKATCMVALFNYSRRNFLKNR